MTLEVQEKLIFSGPFNEKLKGFLTLKNNDQDKKVALKFFSNVYTTKIAVWPKKVLLLPNETVTATFKYRPSHPQVILIVTSGSGYKKKQSKKYYNTVLPLNSRFLGLGIFREFEIHELKTHDFPPNSPQFTVE